MPLPPSAHFFFDNPSPYSTDTLQVQVVDAVDPDGDPLTFQYDWRVNGQLVQTTTSTAPTAVLDLSKPDCGDRGDLIKVFVIVSDGFASSSAITSLTVAASPTELCADYLAAVSQANVVYVDAVGAAVAQRDAAITAARTAAQASVDSLYAVYQGTVAEAQDSYAEAIADAEAGYQLAISAADATWETNTTSAPALYEAAIADARIAYGSSQKICNTAEVKATQQARIL